MKKLILKILHYFRHNKSYSQDGEDVVLYSFYENKKKYRGFYVDIGAHHPVRFSNTYFFYKKGWNGINIDPTPGSMTPFRFLRRRDINLEIGIAEKTEKLTFYCFNEPALNTFDAQVANEREKSTNYSVVKTISVEIVPLKEVLHKHLPLGAQIDFFTIDAEGFDLDVLLSNDWDEYLPNYILVEDVDFRCEEPMKSDIYKFLNGKGYIVSAVLKRTVIYKHGNKQP